jgi:hypothetical protein
VVAAVQVQRERQHQQLLAEVMVQHHQLVEVALHTQVAVVEAGLFSQVHLAAAQVVLEVAVKDKGQLRRSLELLILAVVEAGLVLVMVH